ncbi:MAG TPA: TolC family protein [bacterium]|nr:TolC family protein [bacterium]
MMRILAFILLFLAFPSARAETVAIEFDDLPELIATRNKNVLAGDAYVAGAQVQTGHFKRSFLPKIRAEGGGEIGKTGTFDTQVDPYVEIETRVNVFRGGKDRLEEEIAKSKVDFSESKKEQTFLRELSRARLLFADVLYYQDLLKGLPRVSALTRQQLGMVNKQISAGLTTESDRLGFEIFLNQLKQDQLLQTEDYEHALAEMKAIMGIPEEMEVRLSDGFKQLSENDVLEMPLNLDGNQDILILKKQIEVSEVQKKQAERWWTPAVDVYGGYALYTFRQIQFPTIDERKSAFGGVNVAIPIFDGFSSRVQGKALQHQARGYALEEQQKRRELEVLFEKLKHELKNRLKLMALISQKLSLGDKYLGMASEEYRRGVKTGPQLLEALAQYWDEKRRLADARREYLRIKAELMTLLGK